MSFVLDTMKKQNATLQANLTEKDEMLVTYATGIDNLAAQVVDLQSRLSVYEPVSPPVEAESVSNVAETEETKPKGRKGH